MDARSRQKHEAIREITHLQRFNDLDLWLEKAADLLAGIAFTLMGIPIPAPHWILSISAAGIMPTNFCGTLVSML